MASTIRGSDNFDSNIAGSVIQVQNYTTGAMATGTALIPIDDTIPQNTEGTQFMSLSFTPKKANSLLKIDICIFGDYSVSSGVTHALFRGTGADAIGVCKVFAGGSAPAWGSFSVVTPSVSTSLTTFYVRSGGNTAGTFTFNGAGGARQFGGLYSSSITITEIAQ